MTQHEPAQEDTTEPGASERPRARLADVISRRHRDIEERWLEQVTRSLDRRQVNATELRNGMPEYLSRLADGLRDVGSIEGGGSMSWENVAVEHARTRVSLGFDIDQLVHEFIVLRQIIFGVIEEEEGGRFDARQSARLADLIEGAIQAAVKSYVQSRDYELRRRDAEHLGFITHELRNPLTTAVLATKQLGRALASNPVHARLLELIERNHRRLADLIDGVLHVERGKHNLNPNPTATTMAHLLEPLLAGARLAAEAKGLTFVARFDPKLLVYVDPALTASAIDNIVQNAVKYTDEGDVQLRVDDGSGTAVVHVCDSCPGLTEEELRTIFEPFRRGHSHKPGAGLGLAIAQRAIEAQGGAIHAERGAEKGCHFWLTLPKPSH